MKKNKFDDFEDNEDSAFGSRIKESFEKFFNDLDYEEQNDDFSHIFKKDKNNTINEKSFHTLEPIQNLDQFDNKINESSINDVLNKVNNSSLEVKETNLEKSNVLNSFESKQPKQEFESIVESKTSKKFSMLYSKKDKPKEINNEISLEVDTKEYLDENNLSINKIRSIIEGTLYVMGSNGLNLVEIQKIVNLPLKILKNILEQMMYEKEVDINSGLCIKLYGSTYKLLSKESIYFDICKILTKNESKPFSRSKLEILSIIAYNQPCTKKVIESIRGKDPTHALYSLMELGIIEKHNRSNEPGNPNLYVVTELFFDLFGIKSLSELPKIKPESENLIQNIISSIDE